MYRREVDGRTLSFGHAGMLYNNSFVMYDRETGSLWVHVTGICARGALKGRRLEPFASQVAPWKTWKMAHPDTRVLPGTGRGGFTGTFARMQNHAGFGFHILVNERSRYYGFDTLAEKTLILDEFEGTPVAVVYDDSSKTATAWDRRLDDKTLTLEQERASPEAPLVFRDAETSGTWNPVTGEAIEGPLSGKRLRPVPGVSILRDRWKTFYPTGEVFVPATR